MPSKDKRTKKQLPLSADGTLLTEYGKEEKQPDEKGETMNKTLKIEGMMCPHCEATVKKALESLDGVSEAVVSHEAGTAIVTLTADVENAVLTQAVEAKDYKVLSVD